MVAALTSCDIEGQWVAPLSVTAEKVKSHFVHFNVKTIFSFGAWAFKLAISNEESNLSKWRCPLFRNHWSIADWKNIFCNSAIEQITLIGHLLKTKTVNGLLTGELTGIVKNVLAAISSYTSKHTYKIQGLLFPPLYVLPTTVKIHKCHALSVRISISGRT